MVKLFCHSLDVNVQYLYENGAMYMFTYSSNAVLFLNFDFDFDKS